MLDIKTYLFMKKRTLLSLILVLGALFASQTSQSQVWTGKGDQKFQIGLTPYGYGTGILASYDHGIHEFLSLGLGGEYYFKRHKDHTDDHFFIAGRLNLHLNPLLGLGDKFDIYPGVKLGLHGNAFGWGAHLGLRYMLTPKVGLFGEFGNMGGLGVVINL